MKASLISPRAPKKPPLSSRHVTLRPELGDLFLQCRNVGQIGPQLPVPGKRDGRHGCQLSHPPSQHALRRSTLSATSRSRAAYATAPALPVADGLPRQADALRKSGLGKSRAATLGSEVLSGHRPLPSALR